MEKYPVPVTYEKNSGTVHNVEGSFPEKPLPESTAFLRENHGLTDDPKKKDFGKVDYLYTHKK